MFSISLSKVVSVSTLVFTLANVSQAQQKNDLLDRGFWKEKPTLEMVKQKVAEGHDAAAIDRAQFDATSLAINSGASNDVIFYLLDQKGNDVNKKTHDGRTYMFWASVQNNFKVMKELVKRGTNLKHVDEKGSSIMIYNALNGNKNTEVYDFLIANGTDIKAEKNKAGASVLLLLSTHLKSLDETNYFTAKGLSLTDTDDKGYNIFSYASKGGNIDFLNILIKNGIDAKAIAKDGGNAFIMASQASRSSANKIEMYHYLEGLGLNPVVATTDGTNPLHNVARSKDSEVVAYFIDKGNDVNMANAEGNTPLMLAAAGQQDAANFELFFQKGKNWNYANKEGQTALTMALMSNSPKVAVLLIGAGASATVVDKDGNNLSYYLVRYFKNKEDYEAKLKVLYTFGFKHNELQGNENTLIHVAVREKKKELIQLLAADKSIDLNAVNNDGFTALHLAASTDHSGEYIKALLDLGADKTIATEFGETAFDLAQENELLNANQVDYSSLK